MTGQRASCAPFSLAGPDTFYRSHLVFTGLSSRFGAPTADEGTSGLGKGGELSRPRRASMTGMSYSLWVA